MALGSDRGIKLVAPHRSEEGGKFGRVEIQIAVDEPCVFAASSQQAELDSVSFADVAVIVDDPNLVMRRQCSLRRVIDGSIRYDDYLCGDSGIVERALDSLHTFSDVGAAI